MDVPFDDRLREALLALDLVLKSCVHLPPSADLEALRRHAGEAAAATRAARQDYARIRRG